MELVKFILWARDWENHYRKEILPLRDTADNCEEIDEASYESYDKTYNEHLEEMHSAVLSLLGDDL